LEARHGDRHDGVVVEAVRETIKTLGVRCLQLVPKPEIQRQVGTDLEVILDEQPRYFYNLTRDPYQFHNLAEGEQESEVAQMLDILLREWHKETPGMDEEE
jgi:hypothetical protein